MKITRYIYTTLITATFALGGCNKDLDIKPVTSIDQGQAIKTSDDVQSTLNGTYSRLGSANLYGGRIFLIPDLLATQTVIDWDGTYADMTQFVDQQVLNTNFYAESTWLVAYEAINGANNVLANLQLATNDDEKARWEGEARFIRGLLYFDLVRLYGKAWNDGDPNTNLGVPIVLTPTVKVDESSKVARATVKQGYDQAIADLTAAKTLLPDDNTFYASTYAASAILARLYLQQGNYKDARDEASRVIKSNNYELNDKFSDEFPSSTKTHFDNTSEDIFALQVTQQLGVNGLNEFYASSGNGGRGDIAVKDAFIEEYEAGDVRGEFFSASNRTNKFNNQYGNVHVVRLAEMYLIRAEANVRLGTSVGATAASDVNIIRERAGLDPLAAVDLDSVLTERRHELAFEGGFFLHDAKRLEADLIGEPWDSPKLILPIPQREIIANPKLIQNEGY